MIGPNRPTADFYVVGQPGAIDLTDPTAWSTWRTFVGDTPNRGYGNMVATTDNYAICSFVENNAVYVAFAPSIAGVLDGSQVLAGAIKVKDCNEYGYVQTSLSMIKGKLHLAITNWTHPQTGTDAEGNPIYDLGWVLECEHWIDSAGKGTDFTFHNYISADLSSGTSWARGLPGIENSLGPIIPITEDNWIIVCPSWNYVYLKNKICYTIDGGETWTNGASTPTSLFYYLAGCGVSVLPLPDGSFMCAWSSSSAYYNPLHFTNNGATMAQGEWVGGNLSSATAWHIVGNNIYMFTPEIKIWKFNRPIEELTFEIAIDLSNWTEIGQLSDDGIGNSLITTLTTDALILQHSNNVKVSGAGTKVLKLKIPIKSVVVNRSKGSASRAMVVIDNALGVFSPDSIGEWAKILWPNKKIIIKMGYGDNRQLVFTGLIDDIYMSNFPAELTISSRDYSKLALDQQPQDDFRLDGEVAYAFTYYDKTPEYIFADLAIQAGWPLGSYHTEVTGVTLKEFQTAHESIADCFQRLCEITGWEWFCDEMIDLYFRPARDPAAEKVYTFTEGVDIFSLNYRISDEELYRTIVVYSNDSNRNTLKASVVWPGADYNNILPKKTLIVNAGDLVTDEAGCLAIAQAESNAITPKVREVNFVAVGNPYIQIGDVIQVIETTSWSSEYYRVLECVHRVNPTGKPVFATELKCYHFAYGE